MERTLLDLRDVTENLDDVRADRSSLGQVRASAR
jgi:hypothetical protein